MVLAQQAWLTVDGERQLLAEGTIRIGWVDSQTLKPGRIPATILEALQ
jgi:acyl-CoA thioester hydrolase